MKTHLKPKDVYGIRDPKAHEWRRNSDDPLDILEQEEELLQQLAKEAGIPYEPKKKGRFR